MESLAALTPVHAVAFDSGCTPPPDDRNIRWMLVKLRDRSRISSLTSQYPSVAHRHASAEFLNVATAAAKDTSTVVIDYIGMFRFAGPLKKRLRTLSDPTMIIIDHNHEYSVRWQMARAERRPWMKAALALDAIKAGRLETSALRLADGIVALTGPDASTLSRISLGAPTAVIPPGYDGPVAPDRTITAETPRRLVILGEHTAQHKRMVLERTLEALDRQGVQRRMIVDIVGPVDPGRMTRRYSGFNFRGYVEDLPSYLSEVRLGLIPDEIGGGFKLRALTHAFLRTPLLAVDQAMNGMGFARGQHYVGFATLTEAASSVARQRVRVNGD
jgi:hypothetical protein